MDTVEEFSQESFDSFKIFLISNFNIEFLKSSEPTVLEVVNIKLKNDIINCRYLANQSLELDFHDVNDPSYEKILDFLRTSHKIIQSYPIQDKHNLDELIRSSKELFEHLLNCVDCKEKFKIILLHMKKSQS